MAESSSTECPRPLDRNHSAPCLSSRHHATNPFMRRNTSRDNFPLLDLALSNPEKSKDAVDGSIFSQGSSGLDLSIGAKAALNEHMRHIEKHGLDGAPPPESSSTPRHPLDEQWDLLLDSSGGNSHQEENDSSADTAPNLGSDAWLSMANQEGDQSVEVMTDVSGDYFNSSRVLLLGTPERNKRFINMVSTRDEVYCEEFSDESDFGDPRGILAPELNLALDLSHQNQSFLSLSATDVSRISASDSFAKCSSSDVSVVGHDCRIATDDLNFIIDSSFSSNSRRSSSDSDKKARSSSAYACKKWQQFKRPPTLFSLDKENNNKMITSKIPSISERHAKSTIISEIDNNMLLQESSNRPNLDQACSMVSTKNTNNNVDRFLGIDLLRELEDANNKAPSPPSSPILRPDSFDRGSSSNSDGGSFPGIVSDFLSPLHKKYEKARNSSLSSEGSSSAGSLSGRRRFRTVVPSRVFMLEPSEFPDENDSFSTKN